jgi:hypothetical protein
MVRIAAHDQQRALASNIALLEAKQAECIEQIHRIEALQDSNTACNSAAYRTCSNYINDMKLPFLRQQTTAIDTLLQDMKRDMAELSALPVDAAGIVDTAIIDSNIEQMGRQVKDLQQLKSHYRFLGPSATHAISTLCTNKMNQIQLLENKRRQALYYATNTSIYSDSTAQSETLDRAAAAFDQVRFDETTGRFDLSQVSDWSWRTDETQ